MSDLINRQAAIDIDGLDEEIRCEMCKNPMHVDRGCDGNCKYDEKLYKKIIQILDKRITPLPNVPDTNVEDNGDTIYRQDAIDAVDKLSDEPIGYLEAAIDALVDLPSAQTEEDCDTCKHGYFGDDKCNNCRVRYPSHYERRTDESD